MYLSTALQVFLTGVQSLHLLLMWTHYTTTTKSVIKDCALSLQKYLIRCVVQSLIVKLAIAVQMEGLQKYMLQVCSEGVQSITFDDINSIK